MEDYEGGTPRHFHGFVMHRMVTYSLVCTLYLVKSALLKLTR